MRISFFGFIGGIVLSGCGSTHGRGFASVADGPDGGANASQMDGSPSTNIDAGSDADTRATCGGKTCFVGQSCVSGQCEFVGCIGSRVPGDYPTVQAAVTALGGQPSGGTICLAAQTYDENVNYVLDGPITIQGVGPGRSILKDVQVNNGTGALSTVATSLVLKGLTLHQLDVYNYGSTTPAKPDALTITMNAGALDGRGFQAPSLNAYLAGFPIAITLDGVDISPPSRSVAAVQVYMLDQAPLAQGTTGQYALTFENSYFHDAQVGFSMGLANGSAGFPYTISTTFQCNTFEANGTAVDNQIPDTATMMRAASTQYFNNLVVNNTLGIKTQGAPTFGSNAYYGNTSNFDGTAVAGAGTIVSNPLLGTASVPPALLPGSPARGAGDAAHAPDHDFWGRPRGASIDIGAVQSSP